MNPVHAAWIAALLGLAVFVPLHVILVRVTGPARSFGKFVALLLVMALVVAAASARWTGRLSGAGGLGEAPTALLRGHGVILALFFAALILAFYSAIDHSVRIRLCVEFRRAEGGRLSFARILELYRPLDAVKRRFGKVLYGGYAAPRGDGYELTPKGRRTARAITCMRTLYGLDRAERDRTC